jgi:hypothetical protein
MRSTIHIRSSFSSCHNLLFDTYPIHSPTPPITTISVHAQFSICTLQKLSFPNHTSYTCILLLINPTVRYFHAIELSDDINAMILFSFSTQLLSEWTLCEGAFTGRTQDIAVHSCGSYTRLGDLARIAMCSLRSLHISSTYDVFRVNAVDQTLQYDLVFEKGDTYAACTE